MKTNWKFLKLDILTIIFDFLSFLFGLIGIILGVISLLALNPNWNNTTLSYNVTLVAIVFDIFSCLFALSAFIFGYKYFKNKKSKLINFKHILMLDFSALTCDFLSFLFGLIGVIFEIISLVALLPTWNNDLLSYNTTLVGVIFDIVSSLLAIIAFTISIIVSKIIKK